MNTSENQDIIICLIADGKYNYAMATTIISLLENANETTFYKIYCIVNNTVHLDDIKKILSIKKEKTNAEINILNVNDKYLEYHSTHKYVSISSAYKFLIPELLPQYDKVLYLDTDTLIRGDLSELYRTNLKDNYIGAVLSLRHFYEQKELSNILEIPDMENYFNAGIMLMNTKKMREVNLRKTLESYIGRFKNSVDQHIFNKVCYGHVYFLPLKYNVTPHTMHNYINNEKVLIFYSPKEVYEAIQDPIIVHYAGEKKPWLYTDLPYSIVWNNYYKMTPYNDIILQRTENSRKITLKEDNISFIQAQVPKKNFNIKRLIKGSLARLLNCFILTQKCNGNSYLDRLIQKNKALQKFVHIARPTTKDNIYTLFQRFLYFNRFIFCLKKNKYIFYLILFGKKFNIYDYTPDKKSAIPSNLNDIIVNAKHEQISSNIKKEKVVYTCNIGNYDIMFPQKFFNQEWDYVYITDNPTLLKDQYRNGWKIIPPIFNSGAPQQMHLVHKINAHTMFSEYKESLYIDANINLISNKIFEEIKNHPNNLILVQGHQVPISIYEYIDKTVDDDIIDFNKLMLIKYLLRSNIHKKNIELIDSNVIYRKHNSECIRTVMMQWYSDIINLNMPEKLSLMYNLKLNNIDLNNIVINNINKEHLNYIAYEHLNN